MPDTATLLRMKEEREKKRGTPTWNDVRALANVESRGLELVTVIAWPVRILLPWSHLVSDNDKDVARLITRANGPAAIKVITREYAKAKEQIANLAKGKVGDAAAHAGPLALTVRVWVPDERIHDMTNFCKLVHDALEGVVYENDRWLYDVHWTRAGVDVDAPRAEITCSPLLT